VKNISILVGFYLLVLLVGNLSSIGIIAPVVVALVIAMLAPRIVKLTISYGFYILAGLMLGLSIINSKISGHGYLLLGEWWS
jgi:hypothetical protein